MTTFENRKDKVALIYIYTISLITSVFSHWRRNLYQVRIFTPPVEMAANKIEYSSIRVYSISDQFYFFRPICYLWKWKGKNTELKHDFGHEVGKKRYLKIRKFGAIGEFFKQLEHLDWKQNKKKKKHFGYSNWWKMGTCSKIFSAPNFIEHLPNSIL